MKNLNGLKVAILIENGFERVEMVEPRGALEEAGAETHIVSPRSEAVRSWKFTEWEDKEVVGDGNLVSSRKSADILAFSRAMIDLFGRTLGQARRTA
jgi:putative intracellular protease/amidase